MTPIKRPSTPASAKMSRLLGDTDSPLVSRVIDRRMATMERCKSHQQERILLQLASGQAIEHSDIKKNMNEEEKEVLREAVFKRNVSVSNQKLITFNDNDWNNHSLKSAKYVRLQFIDREIKNQERMFLIALKKTSKSASRLPETTGFSHTQGKPVTTDIDRLRTAKTIGSAVNSFNLVAPKRRPHSRNQSFNMMTQPNPTLSPEIKCSKPSVIKVTSKSSANKIKRFSIDNTSMIKNKNRKISEVVSEIQELNCSLQVQAKIDDSMHCSEFIHKSQISDSIIEHNSYHVPRVKPFDHQVDTLNEGDEATLIENTRSQIRDHQDSRILNKSIATENMHKSVYGANYQSPGKSAIGLLRSTFSHLTPTKNVQKSVNKSTHLRTVNISLNSEL